jgi:hypothetical protein
MKSNFVNDTPDLCFIDWCSLDKVLSLVVALVEALFVCRVASPVGVYCVGVLSVCVSTIVLCTHVGSINI